MRVACQADAFTPSITAATNLAAAATTLRRIISKSNDSHITETIAGIPFLLDTGKSRYWEENFPIFGEVLAKTVSHLQKKNTGQLFLVFFFFQQKRRRAVTKPCGTPELTTSDPAGPITDVIFIQLINS